MNVGASATGTATFTFSATTTVASINVLTQGTPNLDFTLNSGAPGTCAATTYSGGATCTVGVTFTPTNPGVRLGAVTLATATGSQAGGVALLGGTGVGSQGALYNATPTALTLSNLNAPFGLTTDASNNLYITNYGSGVVLKETPAGGNTFTQTTLATGLGNSGGVAVDGAGNVYLNDPNNQRILLETYDSSSGTYSQSVLFTGFPHNTFGMAVDLAGNVYAAAFTDVYLYTLANGSYTRTTLDTGFSFIDAIAVDSTGNVFLADYNAGIVYEEVYSAGSYTRRTVVSGLSNPNGIVVDPAGDIYVSTATANGVYRYTPVAGSPGTYTRSTIGGSINQVNGVAMTASGTIYISSQASPNTVYVVTPGNATLTVPGTTAINTTSPEQTATLQNVGNAPLTFTSIAATGLAASSGTTCTTSTPVAVGATCTVGLTFTPTSHGPSPQSGPLTLQTSTQTITENIAGNVTGDPTHLAFITAPPATLSAGSTPGTVTVTLLDSNNVAPQFYTTPAVTLTVSNGSGYSATYGPTNASNSVVSFTPAGPTTQGPYTYTASSANLVSGIASETVVGGAAASLGIVPASASVQDTIPGNVTVTAYDTYGNITTSTDTVALTSSDSTATLPANFALSSGTATASVTFNRVGTFTVTASDVTHPSVTAGSANVTVTGIPTFTVTTASDDAGSPSASNCTDQVANGGILDASCSLRDAILAINNLGSALSLISFASNPFSSAQTITLDAALPSFANAGQPVSVIGPGQALLTISGNDLYRVFDDAANLNLTAMTIAHGATVSADGACVKGSGPAAISVANVTIQYCNITGLGASGAAIATTGPLTVSNSTLNHNTITSTQNPYGAALYVYNTLTMANSTVTDNSLTTSTGTSYGGGIYANNATITDSLIARNTITATGGTGTLGGGGIFLLSTSTLTRVTVTGNTLNSLNIAFGGGIYSMGSLTLNSSTVTSNTASATTNSASFAYGGGLYVSSATLRNNTISGNTASAASGGAFARGGGLYYTTSPTTTITGNLLDANSVSANTVLNANGGGLTLGPTGTDSMDSTAGFNFISNNTATGNGGGVWTQAGSSTQILKGLVLANNTSTGTGSAGGGLYSASTRTDTLSYISAYGNSADVKAGGIAIDGSTIITANLTNITATGNTARTSGVGGIAIAPTAITNYTFNFNTITGNTGPTANNVSFGKQSTAGVDNIVDGCTTNCPTAANSNLTASTNLGTLAYNGGPAKTILPLTGSNALATGISCTTSDERGYTRPNTTGCDIGAVNTSSSTGPSPITVSVNNATIAVGATASLSATVAYTGTAPSTGFFFKVGTLPGALGTCTGSSSPLTCTATVDTSTLAGGGYPITAIQTGSVTVSGGEATASLAVGNFTQTTPTITVAAASNTYSAATTTLSATLAYTGAVAPTGAFTFQVASGTAVTATCTGASSPRTCTASYNTSALTAGSYTITGALASDSNFTTASGTNTLTITKIAPAAISWTPSGLTGYAPSAIGSSVLNATDATPGTITYTATLQPSGSPTAITASTVLANGTYTITALFTPTDTTDYNTTSATITFKQQNMDVFFVNSGGNTGSLYNNGTSQSAPTSGGGIGAAVDASGNVWSINANGAGVSVFSKTGTLVTTYSGFTGASALAIDGNNHIIITNSNHTVTVLSSGGAVLSTTTDNSLTTPTGVAVDVSGNVWIANSNNTVDEIIGGAAPAAPIANAVINGTPGGKP